MPNPLTAPFRIDLPCNVPGLPIHHTHLYCTVSPTVTADPSGYDLNGGVSAIGFHAAMVNAIPLFAAMYDSTSAVGPATIQQYVSGAWIPYAADTLSAVGTTGGAPLPAAQVSINFRMNVVNNRMRIQLMECSATVIAYAGKFTALGALGVTARNLVTDIVTYTSPHMGAWVKSRASATTPTFFALVLDQNRRLKRKRGLS